jgi:CBS domain-containing protein
MKLTNIVVPTGVVSYGSTVAEAFSECLRCNVPGIPFVDRNGRIIGRFSIRNTIRLACIPNMMIMNADLLGDQLAELMVPDNEAANVLGQPVERFILKEVVTIHSASPCIKAAALMEKHDMTYLFVVDDDKYNGIVNVQGIARRMLQAGAG